MMKNFTAILQKTDDGWWAVSCLEVPGAFSQGRTKKEAMENIGDAIKELLAFRRSEIRVDQCEEAALSLAL